MAGNAAAKVGLEVAATLAVLATVAAWSELRDPTSWLRCYLAGRVDEYREAFRGAYHRYQVNALTGEGVSDE